MSLSLSSSDISATCKIEFWRTTAPFSHPDFLLQCNAIQTEKIGIKWFLTRTARGRPATWNQIKATSRTTKEKWKSETAKKTAFGYNWYDWKTPRTISYCWIEKYEYLNNFNQLLVSFSTTLLNLKNNDNNPNTKFKNFPWSLMARKW